MNRIILIGNGFDLAHGLKTSYKSFIDNLWETKIQYLKNNSQNDNDNEFDVNRRALTHNGSIIKTYKELKEFDLYHKEEKISLKFKNDFLERISDTAFENWVDIENEYFDELKSILELDKSNKSGILQLNKNFRSIKNLLEKYISNELKNKKESLDRNPDIFNKIYSYFQVEDFSKVGLNSFIDDVTIELNLIINKLNNTNNTTKNRIHNDLFEYVTNKDQLGKYYVDNDKLKKLMSSPEQSSHYVDFSPSNCLLLNFNYTNTEFSYSSFRNYFIDENNPKVNINHIHGELESKTNPIIFGYGDEIGKDYALIEEVNNNDLLENVKSIRYLDTDNYKKMLEYVDSDKYQIFIMGHSCGNSDRTLLNTLFEHKNCVSIKVFYHQISETEDNYSDVIRNISRNFNDKKSMREKVVNKKYCSPLVES